MTHLACGSTLELEYDINNASISVGINHISNFVNSCSTHVPPKRDGWDKAREVLGVEFHPTG